jgi:hypothetical protein
VERQGWGLLDECGNEPRQYDCNVSQRIITGRKKCGLGQAAAVVTMTGEQEGAGQVDGKRPEASQRQRRRGGCDWYVELLPSSPKGRQCRRKQDDGERHADPCTVLRRPGECGEDQQIDGGILKEIDRVRE